MAVLSLLWLALLIIDLTIGLTRELAFANWMIWSVFLFDAVVEIILAPDKLTYLRRHWITIVAVAIPALRVVRILRVASAVRGLRILRATRSLRLLRLLTSLNRNIRATRAFFRSTVPLVGSLTLIVVFAGAAGMFSFENPHALHDAGVTGAAGLRSYPEALWWTAMLVTTMGSEYWPKTAEGRVLCLLLAIYSFAVFGYITASLASFIIGRKNNNSG